MSFWPRLSWWPKMSLLVRKKWPNRASELSSKHAMGLVTPQRTEPTFMSTKLAMEILNQPQFAELASQFSRERPSLGGTHNCHHDLRNKAQ